MITSVITSCTAGKTGKMATSFVWKIARRGLIAVGVVTVTSTAASAYAVRQARQVRRSTSYIQALPKGAEMVSLVSGIDSIGIIYNDCTLLAECDETPR